MEDCGKGGRTAPEEPADRYREINIQDIHTRTRKGVKKAEEKWIGEQCSEIEDNLNKNNSKGASKIVKKKEEKAPSKTSQENASQKKERISIDGQSTAPSYTTARPKEMWRY